MKPLNSWMQTSVKRCRTILFFFKILVVAVISLSSTRKCFDDSHNAHSATQNCSFLFQCVHRSDLSKTNVCNIASYKHRWINQKSFFVFFIFIFNKGIREGTNFCETGTITWISFSVSSQRPISPVWILSLVLFRYVTKFKTKLNYNNRYIRLNKVSITYFISTR